MIFSHVWKFGLMGMLFFANAANGQLINWYCPAQKVNLTSSGQDMGADFQFHLGVFTGGFIPTAANLSEWTAHWDNAQSTSYSTVTKSFNSDFTVKPNTAPFTIGAKAYVWGRSVSATKDEWILFRKSDWNWPAYSPIPNPNDPPWNASAADQIILGAINTGGTPFLMKSEAVLSYAQWQTGNLAGEPFDGPNDDPDHDGILNALEFVFGTPPLLAGAPPAILSSFIDVSGQSHLQISIPRLRNRLAKLTVEVSGDLIVWNSGDAFTVEVSNTAETLVVRDLAASGGGSSGRFMRMKAVIQP